MIGVRCCGVVGPVASNARDRRTEILITRNAGVAILAIQRRMFSNERESCGLMPLEHVRYLPRPNGMAPGAIRTELGFVNIGMTCSASLTSSLEF